jgi:hypothetical protein
MWRRRAGVARRELHALEVHVLDPQAKQLQQAQSSAVEERGLEAPGAVELRQHGAHLRPREDGRDAARLPGSGGSVEPLELAVEHAAVDEEQRREGLVLRAGADATLHGEVREERGHLGDAHVLRVALAVEEDEAPRPGDVGRFGPQAQPASARFEADAVEEAGRVEDRRPSLGHGRGSGDRAHPSVPEPRERAERREFLGGSPRKLFERVLRPR